MTDTPLLDEKVLQVDAALTQRKIPHAIGGALALAYYAEPRATIDIDVNVFVSTEEADAVFSALVPLGVEVSDDDRVSVQRDGQVRLWWGLTPIDLFFAYHPFHWAAQARARQVPFGDEVIPVLAPEDLLVCKVVFDRRKDWLDIEQMLVTTAGEIDVDEVRRWLGDILGPDEPRVQKFEETVRQILG